MGACTSKIDEPTLKQNSIIVGNPANKQPLTKQNELLLDLSGYVPATESQENKNKNDPNAWKLPEFYYFNRTTSQLLYLTEESSTEIILKTNCCFAQDSAIGYLSSKDIILVGGLVKSSLVALVVLISPSSQRAYELSYLPMPCTQGQVHEIGEWIYYIGGITKDSSGLRQAPLMRFNQKQNKWYDLYTYGEQYRFNQIINMGTCSVNNKILLIGGQRINSQGILKNSKKIYSISVDTDFSLEFVCKLPIKLLKPIVAAGSRHGIIAGGVLAKTNAPNRNCYCLMIKNNIVRAQKMESLDFDLTEAYPGLYNKSCALFVSYPFIAIRNKKFKNWIRFNFSKKNYRQMAEISKIPLEADLESHTSDESEKIENASKKSVPTRFKLPLVNDSKFEIQSENFSNRNSENFRENVDRNSKNLRGNRTLDKKNEKNLQSSNKIQKNYLKSPDWVDEIIFKDENLKNQDNLPVTMQKKTFFTYTEAFDTSLTENDANHKSRVSTEKVLKVPDDVFDSHKNDDFWPVNDYKSVDKEFSREFLNLKESNKKQGKNNENSFEKEKIETNTFVIKGNFESKPQNYAFGNQEKNDVVLNEIQESKIKEKIFGFHENENNIESLNKNSDKILKIEEKTFDLIEKPEIHKDSIIKPEEKGLNQSLILNTEHKSFDIKKNIESESFEQKEKNLDSLSKPETNSKPLIIKQKYRLDQPEIVNNSFLSVKQEDTILNQPKNPEISFGPIKLQDSINHENNSDFEPLILKQQTELNIKPLILKQDDKSFNNTENNIKPLITKPEEYNLNEPKQVNLSLFTVTKEVNNKNVSPIKKFYSPGSLSKEDNIDEEFSIKIVKKETLNNEFNAEVPDDFNEIIINTENSQSLQSVDLNAVVNLSQLNNPDKNSKKDSEIRFPNMLFKFDKEIKNDEEINKKNFETGQKDYKENFDKGLEAKNSKILKSFEHQGGLKNGLEVKEINTLDLDYEKKFEFPKPNFVDNTKKNDTFSGKQENNENLNIKSEVKSFEPKSLENRLPILQNKKNTKTSNIDYNQFDTDIINIGENDEKSVGLFKINGKSQIGMDRNIERLSPKGLEAKKFEKSEKNEKFEKIEKIEKIEKTEKIEKIEKNEKNEKKVAFRENFFLSPEIPKKPESSQTFSKTSEFYSEKKPREPISLNTKMLNPLGSQKLNLDTIKTSNPINEENKWVSSTISKDIKTDTQNTKFFNPSNNIKEDVIKKKNIESFNSKNKDEFDGFEIVSGINLNKGKPLGYTLENPEKKASEWKNEKIDENNWKLLETEENNPEKINIRPLSADKSPEKSMTIIKSVGKLSLKGVKSISITKTHQISALTSKKPEETPIFESKSQRNPIFQSQNLKIIQEYQLDTVENEKNSPTKSEKNWGTLFSSSQINQLLNIINLTIDVQIQPVLENLTFSQLSKLAFDQFKEEKYFVRHFFEICMKVHTISGKKKLTQNQFLSIIEACGLGPADEFMTSIQFSKAIIKAFKFSLTKKH